MTNTTNTNARRANRQIEDTRLAWMLAGDAGEIAALAEQAARLAAEGDTAGAARKLGQIHGAAKLSVRIYRQYTS